MEAVNNCCRIINIPNEFSGSLMKRLVNLFYCSLSDESRFQSSLPHLYRIWTILYHLNIYMFIYNNIYAIIRNKIYTI